MIRKVILLKHRLLLQKFNKLTPILINLAIVLISKINKIGPRLKTLKSKENSGQNDRKTNDQLEKNDDKLEPFKDEGSHSLNLIA